MTQLPPLSEFQEQVILVQWLELKGFKFTSIPNSTWTKSIQQKIKNKRSGLRAGLPDLVVAIPHVGVVWIELKRTKLGRVSDVQQDWIDTLNKCPGNQAYVCLGASAAIDILNQYADRKADVEQSGSMF